jgi:rhamnosyltransferase
MKSIGVIIPTFCASKYIEKLIYSIKMSQLKIKLLVIDSSSSDDTATLAARLGAAVMVIPQNEFNHGATRELGRKYLNTDIAIMLTQDALPVSDDAIVNLIAPLLQDNDIVVSYGRQIPNDGAGIFEAYLREFNYGVSPQVRSINDVEKYGVYAFFCSNCFAAYDNIALDKIGGFPTVLTNEDYFAVAELLKLGFKIAYVPKAVVKHSHSYTLWEEFRRYFDTGYVRSERPAIQTLVGNAETRGLGYASGLVKKLLVEHPLLIPYAILQTATKWLGYRIGFHSAILPLCLKRRISQQSYYWLSSYYKPFESE